MYTLDDIIKNIVKSALINFVFALFCALFGAIYEIFSHEVYSYFMIYAFAIPLVMGTAFYILILRFAKRKPERISVSFWNMAIATLTFGSIFKGVIDIYGTTNRLIIVYPVAAAVLVVFAIASYLMQREKQEEAIVEVV